jgi:hypothetical protein
VCGLRRNRSIDKGVSGLPMPVWVCGFYKRRASGFVSGTVMKQQFVITVEEESDGVSRIRLDHYLLDNLGRRVGKPGGTSMEGTSVAALLPDIIGELQAMVSGDAYRH